MQFQICLDLESERVQAHLLAGLEQWVQLGLLSDGEMRELAATLSQPLPVPYRLPEGISGVSAVAQMPDERSVDTLADLEAEPLATGAPTVTDSPVASPGEVHFVGRLVQSLVAEISVVWLLFLGVFLVVVSSGVLAASQWQSFSPVGQYAILLTYTLCFWGGSGWANRQPHLQTTARMLRLTTLLIIPVNFWMMDALGVMGSALGLGLAGLATLILTVLPFQLLDNRLTAWNALGLSWLHWGWGWVPWPLLATYAGIVGTTAHLTYQEQQTARRDPPPLLSFETLAITLSLLVVLARSLWIAQVPLDQLGLALGICGWLLVRLTHQKASQVVWARTGWGLLLWGWAVSVGHEPPWQAIGVSGLGLWLLGARLKSQPTRWGLLQLIGVSFQAYWLLWFTLPATVRGGFLTTLSNQFSQSPIQGETWASLGLFPYVLGLLWLAGQFRRRQMTDLARQSELVSLLLGVFLAGLSLSNSFCAVVNLSLSTLTLGLRSRVRTAAALIELTHVTGILALLAWINYLAPDLSGDTWAAVGLGIAIAEWLMSVWLRHAYWRQSTWRMGWLAAGVAYLLLLVSSLGQWPLVQPWRWLTMPVMLTLVANHQRALRPQAAVGFSLVAFLLQTVWLTDWPIAIVSFALGTLCTLLNSRIWRTDLVGLFAVGSGVAWVNSMLWHWGMDTPSDGQWLVYGALQIWTLWLLQRFCQRRPGQMAQLYGRATRSWGGLLLLGLLLGLTLLTTLTYTFPSTPTLLLRYSLLATGIALLALLETARAAPRNWQFWSLAWLVALGLALGLALRGLGVREVAIATLALGLATHLLADGWVLKQRQPYRSSWHGIPLMYGVLGWGLGHFQFDAETGYYTLVASLIAIGVGRRQASLHPLSYIGLVGVSWGAYELLVYHLLQAEGGRPGDGLTLMAGLALGIALVERWLGHWLRPYLQIQPQGLRSVAHLHWGVGSFLTLLAALTGVSHPQGILLWAVIALLLAGYALIMGNRYCTHEHVAFNAATWTWLGLIEATLGIAYARFELFPDLTVLLTWGGLFASMLGLGLYGAPWDTWGWPVRPWRQVGLWLPLLTLSITINQLKTQNLLIVGAFYAWMGKQMGQVRLSYWSVVLFDWAAFRALDQQGWLTPLWFNTMVGLSVLYVAEVEPYFRAASAREKRHWLRSLATGLIGLTALYQVEISEARLAFAGFTLLLSIGFILAGLVLKVRAFLYGGTVVFVLQVIRILWLFVSTNALLLWAIGIVLGLMFIWIAATFESRRSQVTSLLESWAVALESWD
jgi:hypothetical protein